ncbi:hypothetical protein DFH27DRAFT_34260 [Peziza echinospora]|nr:hypothetical protein DFH27DRAFT_34260 [Peziza echinospora]
MTPPPRPLLLPLLPRVSSRKREREMQLYPGASRTPSTPQESAAQKEISTLLSRTTPTTPASDFAKTLAHVPAALGQNLGNIEPLCAFSRKFTQSLTSPQKLLYRLAIEAAATPVLYAQHGGEGVLCDKAHEKYGKLWQLDAGTRSYVRLLSDVTYYKAEMGDWQSAAEWGLRSMRADERDNCKLRDRVGAYLVLAGRFSEAAGFCWGWLVGDGMKGPGPGVEREIDPSIPLPNFANLATTTPPQPPATSPPSTTEPPPPPPPQTPELDPHSLLFTLALSLFHLFPPTTTSPHSPPVSALLQADSLNPHTLRILLSPPSTHPTTQFIVPRATGSREEASDYVFFTRHAWQPGPVRAWLEGLMLDEGVMLGRKVCAGGCGRREARVGEWKACGGCQAAGKWYCGVACQKRDWVEGGHKAECKRRQRERKEMERMKGYGV